MVTEYTFPATAVSAIAGLLIGESPSIDLARIEVPYNIVIADIAKMSDHQDRSAAVSEFCEDNGINANAFHRVLASEDIKEGSNWPAPLSPAAFHGPVGALVREVAPHTEADEAGLLVPLLVALGNAVGRGPHIYGGGFHHANEFVCLVGESAHARKGTGWGMAHHVMKRIEHYWAKNNVYPGIATGEGLVQLVHDDIIKKEWDDKEQEWVELKIAGGITDKRALIWASEFGSVLQVMSRPGVTLPAILRESWDGGVLGNLNKTSPLTATDAHISIVSAITINELLNLLGETDAINGFANRFCWVCVKKARNLPAGGEIPETLRFRDLIAECARNLGWARDTLGKVIRTDEAYPYWERLYNEYDAKDTYGIHRSVTSRGIQHIIRFSLIYAFMDGEEEVREAHIKAAEAVWEYCSASAKVVFGNSTGNEMADLILDELQEYPDEGLSLKEIKLAFGKGKPNAYTNRALSILEKDRLAKCVKTLIGQDDIEERWLATNRK